MHCLGKNFNIMFAFLCEMRSGDDALSWQKL